MLSPTPATRHPLPSELSPLDSLSLFISHITNPHPTWVATPSSDPPQQIPPLWHGVHFDKNQKIQKLTWDALSLQGNLTWGHLPRSVTDVFIWNNHLTGSLHLPESHPHLCDVRISDNALDGTIGLDALPLSLAWLNGSSNGLTGEASLCFLPPSLCYLNLTHNHLSGHLYLNLLPLGMEHLYLSFNALGATLDLTALPESLRCLHLDHNAFWGPIVIGALPRSKVVVFQLQHNHLWGPVVLLNPGGSKQQQQQGNRNSKGGFPTNFNLKVNPQRYGRIATAPVERDSGWCVVG